MDSLPPRLDRAHAVEYLRKKHGVCTTVRTMETLPIAYRSVLGRSLYEIADLDNYAETRLATAPRQIGRDWTGERRARERAAVAA